MRLNRENTLIENNLYPLAGFKPADVQAKFVSVLKPFETDILNIESALLLHNIPLFGALAGFFIGFWLLSRIICPAVISTLSYAFIVIPLFHLFYLVGGVDFGRKLYAQIPELPENDPTRVRPLTEIVSWFWFPILWGWRAAFFVYRTFVCPNLVDTAFLIIATFILNLFARIISPFTILFILIIVTFSAPAILTRTPARELFQQALQQIKEKVNQKKE